MKTLEDFHEVFELAKLLQSFLQQKKITLPLTWAFEFYVVKGDSWTVHGLLMSVGSFHTIISDNGNSESLLTTGGDTLRLFQTGTNTRRGVRIRILQALDLVNFCFVIDLIRH